MLLRHPDVGSGFNLAVSNFVVSLLKIFLSFYDFEFYVLASDGFGCYTFVRCSRWWYSY